MITKLHPKRVIEAMDQIDSEKPSHTLDRRTALRRVFSVLATVCVCLLIIHYMKYFSSFRSGLTMLSEAQGLSSQHWYQKLSNAGLLQLASYSWWTFWHIVGYVLIPFIIIKYHLKTSFTDMGWRWADTGKHWSGYVLLISPILLFIFLVSFRGDFLNHYPFYKQAQRSWFDFVTWEMLYLTQSGEGFLFMQVLPLRWMSPLLCSKINCLIPSGLFKPLKHYFNCTLNAF